MNHPYPPPYGYPHPGYPHLGYPPPESRLEKVPLFPNDVPARVQVAVVFLRDLSAKTSPILLAKEEAIGGGHDLHDGQDLRDFEVDAQREACGLLERYFQNKMELDPQEDLRVKAGSINIGGGDLPPGGKVMVCPRCQERTFRGLPPDECQWCRGTRGIVVYPLNQDGQQPTTE